MANRYFMRTASGDVFSTMYPEYHKDCEGLSRAEGERIYKAQESAQLKKWLKPGATVYCVLRHVSTSGMSRRISFFAIHKGEMRLLDGCIETLTSYKRHASKDGIRVDGCGMDMGFAVVYALGAAMWPKGTPKPHGRRNGEPDSDGGYALTSIWL